MEQVVSNEIDKFEGDDIGKVYRTEKGDLSKKVTFADNKVNLIDFDRVLQNRISRMYETSAVKSSEYSLIVDALHSNRLYNFEVATAIFKAAGFESSREREILSMGMKHIVSVFDLVRKTMLGEVITEKMIDDKLGDNIMYLVLLEAGLYAEQKCIREHNSQKGSSGKQVS